MLTIAKVPGLVDQPKSLFTAGSVLSDLLLNRLQSNAAFGTVAVECFHAQAIDGDTISPPISPVDGYQYAREECFICGAYSYSHYGIGPTPPGQLLLLSSGVDQDGVVSLLTAYYVQGGQQTNTNDGLLDVWVIAQRGWGGLTLSSSPVFNDVPDSAFAQDVAVSQGVWQHLNENSRLASVRSEFFLNNSVPIVSLARNNNVVTATTRFAHQLAVGDPVFIAFAGDAAFNSSGKVPTTQVQTPQGAFTVTTVPNSTSVSWTQNGPNASSLGGRLQKGWYKNGETVPAPISPIDGYQYSYGELRFLPFLIYSGNPAGTGPSGGGRLRRIGPININPTNGAVSSSMEYWDGSTLSTVNDGRIGVATFAMRNVAGSPPFSGARTSYVDLAPSSFFAQPSIPGFSLPANAGRLTDQSCLNLSHNIEFAIGRPEWFFVSAFGSGTIISLPTSPLDNTTYARNQCLYFTSLQDTGDAGTGCITSFSQVIDQTTGLPTCTVNGASGGQLIAILTALRG